MEELMQLFLACKSHFNDVVKQSKQINASQSVIKIQLQFELLQQHTQVNINRLICLFMLICPGR